MNITNQMKEYMLLYEKNQNENIISEEREKNQELMDELCNKFSYRENIYMQTWVASKAEWLEND